MKLDLIRKKTKMEPVCIERETNGIPYFTFQALDELPFVKHMFTTRLGGVSTGDCESMNLNFDREETREPVLENYRRIGEIFSLKPEDFVLSQQTHTTNVMLITEKERGMGVTKERSYQNVDGLITNTPGIALTTIYADCVPLIFADPVNKAVGVSHSGWKGTVNKMGKATIEAMGKCFGTKPEDVICVVAPSICVDCYEVSKDVADQFVEAFGLEESLTEYPGKSDENDKLLYRKNEEKYQLNLWEANRQVLLEAGLLEEHIYVTDVCTCCNPKLLFSHRASKGRRGNLAAIIAIQ